MLKIFHQSEYSNLRASLLYLAPVEWASLWQRPQHLASRLAHHYELCYVDPVGLRNVRLSDVQRIFRRILPSRAPIQSRTAVAPCPVLRPRYVPLLGPAFVDRCNKRWLTRQITASLAAEAGQRILWIGTPSLLAVALIEADVADVVVYDCMDRYAAFHGGATARRIERAEEAIVARADLVFATSRNLQHWLSQANDHVVLAPNCVDFKLFARDRFPAPPSWARRVERPVIGYYGTVGEWLNYPLLEELAKSHPQWSFVFLGPLHTKRASRLFSLENVEYLGSVPYEELARHAARFDVALIPFELNELTRCVHPIKALEYLALGLPTVSADLPDLADLGHVIQFADTAQEWGAAIEANLDPSMRSTKMVALRRASVQDRSWDRLIEQIDVRLQAALGHSQSRRDILKISQFDRTVALDGKAA